MKLSTYAFAAAVVATITTPTFASAQDVRVRIGEDHGMSRDYDRGYRGPSRGISPRSWMAPRLAQSRPGGSD
ncbi:hypothetical protein [Tardiphaga sp. 709]|uniref:hypothetical protein n=1 Tax=Tardiphaga sp. 709 TaxID=3076039 RepID=UPI0028E4116F|nr:hypothetical protein [Tardiphaga sp. 709]WNV11643.1 hypothetical protein RSO67_10920 [Tardiphaga sp. 709]